MSRVLIGGRSRTVGNSRLLATKKKGGDTPRGVSLSGSIQINGTWNLVASWYPPVINDPPILSYSIQIQQTLVILPAVPTWGAIQSTTAIEIPYLALPDGIYKVRVRAEYGGVSSDWVESPLFHGFVNVQFAGAPFAGGIGP